MGKIDVSDVPVFFLSAVLFRPPSLKLRIHVFRQVKKAERMALQREYKREKKGIIKKSPTTTRMINFHSSFLNGDRGIHISIIVRHFSSRQN